MKDRYTKDVENQNYDLMKMLAETQELLENYTDRLTSNNKLFSYIIIELISNIRSKTKQLHRMKYVLEENDIPHNYEDIDHDIHIEASSVSEQFLHNMFSTICENNIKDPVFPTEDFDIFEKYIGPLLYKDEKDEPDEHI